MEYKIRNKFAMIDKIVNWWKQPFSTQGSALNWVLFVGLLIVAAFLWQTVLIAGFSERG
jgi:hypothetical protein